MQLDTSLSYLELSHRLMNGAGCCKTLADVAHRFAVTPVSAIVLGSITMEERAGNSGNVYWPDPDASYALNSLGLPNPGMDETEKDLPAMKSHAAAVGKPLIVSVAGFSPEEYAELTERSLANGADLVELNLGCPNVWDDGEQKGIPSFYPDQVDAIIKAVRSERLDLMFDLEKAIGIKLSPISNPVQLREIAEVIGGRVAFVTTSNTLPNSIAVRADGRPVIDVGFAGMSGKAMKPIALGQVKQLREYLPISVDIIGAGGVTSSADILDYVHAGASAVQAATAYWSSGENPRVFADILSDADDHFETPAEQTA